jgi:hypothetical protein
MDKKCNNIKNTLKNNISPGVNSAMPAKDTTTTTKTRYSKQLEKIKSKIDKSNKQIEKLEKPANKFSFSNINAKSLKDIGFKTKAIAKKFASLSDIKIKDYNTQDSFINELKTRVKAFKSIGLDFNKTLKMVDTATPKVAANRNKKELGKYQNKFETTVTKVKQIIQDKTPVYKIVNTPNDVHYEFLKIIKNNKIRSKYIAEFSQHYLKFKNYTIGAPRDYVPKEKLEHARKKTLYFGFSGNIYELKQYINDIYNKQKHTFKITFEFEYLLIKKKTAVI